MKYKIRYKVVEYEQPEPELAEAGLRAGQKAEKVTLGLGKLGGLATERFRTFDEVYRPGTKSVVGKLAFDGDSAEASSTFEAPGQRRTGIPKFSNVRPRDVPKLLVAGRTVITAPEMPIRLIPQVGVDDESGEGEAWGIGAVAADRSELKGEGVCVAVLDSGIDVNHPAFKSLDINNDNYRDFTRTGKQDSIGHGTHCAGIIFGQTIDGKRIAVAPGVRAVLIGKIADKNFAPTTEHLEKAIDWAVAEGADIISVSFGIDLLSYTRALQDSGLPRDVAIVAGLNNYRDYTRYFDHVISKVMNAGAAGNSALVIVAAGNDSCYEGANPFRVGATLPAKALGVISVGAVGKLEDKLVAAPFSNSGADVCAPGVKILSAVPGGKYVAKSGTSQATPHVAGVAALWWQFLRNQFNARPDPGKVASFVMGHTKQLDSLKKDFDATGVGLVQAPTN